MGGCNPCKTMTKRYNVLRISQLLLFNYFRRGRCRRTRSERRVTGRMHSFDVPRGLVDPTNRMVLVNLADDTRYYSFVYKDFFFRQLRAGLNAEYEEVSANGVHSLQYEQSPNVDEQSAHRQGNASSSRSIPVLLRQLPHIAPDEENRALRAVSGHKKHVIEYFWLLNCIYTS